MSSTRRSLILASAGAALAACEADELSVVGPPCAIQSADVWGGLLPGDSTRLAASVFCSDVANPRLVWSTSTPDVVRVDANTGLLVALRSGLGVVSAAVAHAPDVSRRIEVIVQPCPVAPRAIAVTPSSLTLVPGGVGVLRVSMTFAPCAQARDTSYALVSSDTTVVSIDASGRVVGRRPGAAAVSVIPNAYPNMRAVASVVVSAPLVPVVGLTATPASLVLGVLDTARVRGSVTLGQGAPPGTSTAVTFRAADPCAAHVDSTGLVTALRGGGETTISVAAVASPTVAQPVRVTLLPPPRGPSLFLAALAPADPSALRGTVTATAGIARHAFLGGGRVELWLGGRLAASTPLARFTPGEQVTRVPLSVNTSARDSAGAPLYPNGARELELRVLSDGIPAVPGCAALPAGLWGSTRLAVTLANP
jgi:uncharacterized protein YjdB